MPAARDIPIEWRVSVKRSIDEWVAAHFEGKRKPTTRQIAVALGMKQPTVNQLMNLKGSLGIHVLLQVRKGTGKTLDQLLGLKPLDELTPAEVRRLRVLIDDPTHSTEEDPTHAPPSNPRPSRRHRVHE
jgi:transcriptional regulator with XRE-family HTH domain